LPTRAAIYLLLKNINTFRTTSSECFFLYDVPGGETRAGHALKTCNQFIIAVNGSFNVILDDGSERQSCHLNRSYYGLHVPPSVWRLSIVDQTGVLINQPLSTSGLNYYD